MYNFIHYFIRTSQWSFNQLTEAGVDIDDPGDERNVPSTFSRPNLLNLQNLAEHLHGQGGRLQ